MGGRTPSCGTHAAEDQGVLLFPATPEANTKELSVNDRRRKTSELTADLLLTPTSIRQHHCDRTAHHTHRIMGNRGPNQAQREARSGTVWFGGFADSVAAMN